MVHATIAQVTARIVTRSAATRGPYLARIDEARDQGPARAHLSCSGQAHAYAGAGADQQALATGSTGHLGIVTSYNDMLSAHQPFERYPDVLRQAARSVGGTAQVAGGVPAMCDGVTQGAAGM
ncbi:MAG TPA: phosphogluconate dehydratase, partial [Ruegeria sp.]|nr:phosphogluconate dehydratase [Ruegeria sp.]